MASVVTPDARRRWLAVAVGTTVLVGALAVWPRATAAVGVPATTATPASVMARALASARVPFSATGESRGGLALPDVRGFGDLAALLGGTTRTRVWWHDPGRWRVDVVGLTGETDTYGLPSSTTTWDYESRRLVTVIGDPPVRLPRAEDLVAPQATRRLLATVGPGDSVTALPARRVDGRTADGLRVVPGDQRSTIARADAWVDRDTGLPLRLEVVGSGGATALVTEIDGVHVGRPPAEVLTPPAPPTARRELDTAPDLLARVAGRAPWRMPERLAGLTADADPAPSPLGATGATVYGAGLVRVAVVPLPRRTTRDIVANAAAAGSVGQDVPGGTVVRIGSSLLNAVVALGADGQHSYVLAGLVQPALLDAVAEALFALPPTDGLR
jgi:hypothetical protein